MLIRDNLITSNYIPLPDASRANADSIRDTYVPTKESCDASAKLLQALSGFPNPQPSGFVLSGPAGTGKTHLMQYLADLLANPASPGWETLGSCGLNIRPPANPLKTLFLSVPGDPSVGLARFLSESIGRAFSYPNSSDGNPSPEELAAALLVTASEFISASVALLVVDNVSRRLERLADTDAVEHDAVIYRTLMEVLSQRGVLVLLLIEDRHLQPAQFPLGQGQALDDLARLSGRIRLSRQNIAEIIAKSLAPKNEDGKEAVRHIVLRLRNKLPWLNIRTANFVDLYPIHPLVFTALFKAREVLPEFSPLDFTYKVINQVRERPCENLVVMDELFDSILPALQGRRDFQPLLQAYELAMSNGILKLKPALQVKAIKLLKVITLWTILERQPATVKLLTNALLLCDETEFLPSYSLVAALLLEMEQLGEFSLLAEGEKLERGYRLLSAEAKTAAATRNPWEREDFRLKFPLVLCDWIQREMPLWKLDMSSTYQRSSQSLVAPMPDGDSPLRGLVHIKSPFDPPWSDHDLASLAAAAHNWILLILSPFERFFEFDPVIRKIAQSSPRIMVWRPDAPHSDELDLLHQLIARYPLPWESAPSVDWDPLKVKKEIWASFNSLYIHRGQILTATEQWTIADEIENRSPRQYLAACLASIASLPPAGQGPEEVPPDQTEIVQTTLHWAAQLSGLEVLRSMSLPQAEERLLAWWNSSFEFDSSILLSKFHPLPDFLLTTRFQNEVKSFEISLGLIKPMIERLRGGDLSFIEAMALVASHFRRDIDRLAKWRRLLENLAGFLRWSVSFGHAKDYIHGAYPTGQEEIDRLRRDLLQSMDQPHRFLDADERNAFDQAFLEFKAAYADHYNSMHEDIVQVLGDLDKIQARLDSTALRNLEMLSKLHHFDAYYLNRARVLAGWAQRNQCQLPVRSILDRYPRCFCNFNPTAGRHAIASIDRINDTISEGVEHFRNILRINRQIIIQEIEPLRLDKEIRRQIASLLAAGALVPLEARTIKALNKIVQAHSVAFLTVIRGIAAHPRGGRKNPIGH